MNHKLTICYIVKYILGISMFLLIGIILLNRNRCERLLYNSNFECDIVLISLDYNISFEYFNKTGRKRSPENIYFDLEVNNIGFDTLLVKDNFIIGLIEGEDSIQFRQIYSQQEYLVKEEKCMTVFVYPYDKMKKLDVKLSSDGIIELAKILSDKKYYFSSIHDNKISVIGLDIIEVGFNFTDTTFAVVQ